MNRSRRYWIWLSLAGSVVACSSGSDFDLASFILDAVANGSADMSAGKTSKAFASTWYLTDVIAGFQIWSGSDAAGLKCTTFSCRVE